MSVLQRASAVALVLALSSLPSAGLAQGESVGSPAPTPPAAVDDRLSTLEALLPVYVAGLPLADDLRIATGEQLVEVMRPEEAQLLAGLLETSGKSPADYAAAASSLAIDEERVAVIQAHRIGGLAASDSIDTWVSILSLDVPGVSVEATDVLGHPVTRLTDPATPTAAPLLLFPLDDVVWMVWTGDDQLGAAAIEAIAAARAGQASADEEG